MRSLTLQNRKSFIFLFEKKGEFFASLVSEKFAGSISLKAPAISKQISKEEFDEIVSRKDELATKNIFVVEVEADSTRDFILEAPKADAVYGVSKLIASPYFKYFSEELPFLTVQKTRGPNE